VRNKYQGLILFWLRHTETCWQHFFHHLKIKSGMNFKPQTALNILLAEDDADDRSFFEKALKEISIVTQLKIVCDGEELMNYLTTNYEQLPDVLFLDLSMPRKTGFECLGEIKEDKKLKDLPVVIFTIPFGRSIDFEKTMMNSLSGMGAQEYISKPNNLEQLKQVIHQALIRLIEKGDERNYF
jgi:CheY-like chemotaxis protein